MEGMEAVNKIVTLFAWIMGIETTIGLFLFGLYGKWIWDINRKVSTAVTGSKCESRNDNHYDDAKDLRLEIKSDIEKIGKSFDADIEKIGARFSEGIMRLSRERDANMKSLKEQLIDHNKMIAAQNQANIDQQQNNFEMVVGVLEKIGCQYPKKN